MYMQGGTRREIENAYLYWWLRFINIVLTMLGRFKTLDEFTLEDREG